jgi:hypothetical protein
VGIGNPESIRGCRKIEAWDGWDFWDYRDYWEKEPKVGGLIESFD